MFVTFFADNFSDFWKKFRFSENFQIFGKILDFWKIFRSLEKFLIFGKNVLFSEKFKIFGKDQTFDRFILRMLQNACKSIFLHFYIWASLSIDAFLLAKFPQLFLHYFLLFFVFLYLFHFVFLSKFCCKKMLCLKLVCINLCFSFLTLCLFLF